jgi:hypothetical protein
MYITPQFKRRIHIVGKPDDVRGYMLNVYDTESSKEILNITRIELILDVNKQNVAKITYYKRGELIQSTVTVDNPSLNLTAWGLAGDDGEQEKGK